MILERTSSEILVRLPSSVDLTELQDMIDYLKFKEFTSNSKSKQSDADMLAISANKTMWSKIKERRNIK